MTYIEVDLASGGILRRIEVAEGGVLPPLLHESNQFMVGDAEPGAQFLGANGRVPAKLNIVQRPDGSYEHWSTEQRAVHARARRTILLAESDWRLLRATESPGNPVSQAWRAYRQALRDLSAQPGFPDSIIWPEPPPQTA